MRRQRAARHDARHRAAEADEHRHDAAPGETETAQQLVHDEGNARHVAAVFEHGQEEKQHDDDRDEAQHAADAAENAVDNERVDDGVDVRRGERAVRERSQRVDPAGEQTLQRRTDDVEGEVKHQRHNGDKRRNGGIFPGQHPVDLAAADMLAAFTRADDRARAEAVDKVEAHIRDCRGAVEPALGLHLDDNMLHHLALVFAEVQRLCYKRVALDKLACGEAQRDARRLCVVFNEVHNAVEAAVDRATVGVLVAEIDATRLFLIARDVHRVAHELVDALLVRGRDRYDGNAEHRFHFIDADRAAVAAHLVHHVQCEHDRRVQLHQLHCEIEVALDVRRIGNVDDACRLLLENELARDDFLR